ncbi:MAG TPA: cytochrome c biogenesis protein CcsA [Candidatus Aminicenantes bacterium]|nr:cytochrome c biogenesis protein CcsA [Candidatus Aminicenantes bacterium]
MDEKPRWLSLVLGRMGSLKLTVLILSLIAFLVIAGTVCQAQAGVYAAQRKVFAAWIYRLFGVIPLPGMRLAGVLFIANLLAAFARRPLRRWRQWGLALIHGGLLLMIGGGFFIAATAQESYLTLREGESAGHSLAAGEWQLAVRSRSAAKEREWAEAMALLEPGRERKAGNTGLILRVERRLANCRQAGPALLEPLPPADDPEENTPGLVLGVGAGNESRPVSLFGGEERPIFLKLGGKTWDLSLRPQRIPLPLRLKLLDFKAARHEGTDVPKSFESWVELDAGGERRRALISMNKPLRFRGYTFYQSSYAVDPAGNESSTLAVVRSAGAWLPYAASALMFLGLLLHLSAMVVGRPRSPKPAEAPAKGARLLLLLLACTLPGSAFLAAASPPVIQPFPRLAVLDQGRVKPMDTFARNLLKQFSGRSSLNGMDAPSWLARVFFSPWEAHDDAVFLVNHPDVLPAIGFTALGRARVSFRQLQPHLAELQRLAGQSARSGAAPAGAAESEILRLYDNVSEYYHLARAFHFAWSGRGEGAAAGQGPQAPAIVPPAAGGAGEWLGPALAWSMRDRFPGDVARELDLLIGAVRAYGQRDWKGCAAALDDFNRSLDRRSPIVRQGRKRMALEVATNRFDPFFKALLAYGLAALLLVASWLLRRRRLKQLATVLLLAGWAVHSGGLVARVLIMGRPPVTNLYETFVFVGWAGAVLGLGLEAFEKRGLGLLSGALAGLVSLAVAGRYAVEGDTMGMLAAVLDSNLWLSTHVATISLGYAGCVVAGIIGHWSLVRELSPRRDEEAGARRERMLLAALGFGLAFTAVGTAMGGIWADQSWGRFWGWDPKENGALLIILWCAILLHARRAGWLGRAGLAAGAVGVIVAVALTWFGVNLLGKGLHAYGFTHGVGRALAAFVMGELLFVALVLARLMFRRPPG